MTRHGFRFQMVQTQRQFWRVCVCVCVCVCVWNFSREVKLVPALPWQYFGNIWIYSVELLLHLVFRMSICLFSLCLLKKFYPYCSTILAGGTGPLWIPVPTKLFHNGGSEDWSPSCTCRTCPWWWNCVVVTFLFVLGKLLFRICMEQSLSWTWHRTCYQSYPSVYPVVDVRQGATGPGLRPWATPAQGKAWLGETKCRIYIFQPSNSSK